jgi:hypothetical protein
MKIGYLEQSLHIKVRARPLKAADDFPLYLKAAYDFSLAKIGDAECVVMAPKESVKLPVLKKQVRQAELSTGKVCVLWLEKMGRYAEQRLIAEGIPFFVSGGTIYLPFLGALLAPSKERAIKQTGQISFLAQRMLLTALYEGWESVTVSDAAKALGVTEMSASRAFDDVEAVLHPYVKRMGRKRIFTPGSRTGEYLEQIWPVLRDPVIAIYRMDDAHAAKGLRLCGMSAISRYSMLADNSYPTYGVTREQAKALPLVVPTVSTYEDEPITLVMVLRYIINYGDGSAVDPISAILSLRGDDADDPRAEKVIEEIKRRLAG